MPPDPYRRLASAVLVFLAAMLLMGMSSSTIQGDEVVVFYPTVGYRDGDGWTLPIHGVIYKLKDDSRLRAAAVGLFRRLFGAKGGEGGDVFNERARLFLVDNQRGRSISVQVGPRVFPAGTSGANGHFWGSIRLGAEEATALLRASGGDAGWIAFRAVTGPGDDRVFSGKVALLAETGISVISDVDDTIKVTEVRNRRELLANTFLREFRAVPGMAAVNRRWAAAGAALHYVSESPWQLYSPLAQFLTAEGFPDGSFHLKLFRAKDPSFFQLFADPEAHKRRTIEPLLKTFPNRKFVLVGDSGEKDPEVYGALAREHADQIARVLIRDVTGEPTDAQRYRSAFRGIGKDRWMVFRNAEEIRDVPLR